jgi:hypothetical protein
MAFGVRYGAGNQCLNREKLASHWHTNRGQVMSTTREQHVVGKT